MGENSRCKSVILFSDTEEEKAKNLAFIQLAKADGWRVSKHYYRHSKIGCRCEYSQEIYWYDMNSPDNDDYRHKFLKIDECSPEKIKEISNDISYWLNKDIFRHKFRKNFLGKGTVKIHTNNCNAERTFINIWILTKEVPKKEDLKFKAIFEELFGEASE